MKQFMWRLIQYGTPCLCKRGITTHYSVRPEKMPRKSMWECRLRRTQPCWHWVLRLYIFQNVWINFDCLIHWIWVDFYPAPCTLGGQIEGFIPGKQVHYTDLVRKNGCVWCVCICEENMYVCICVMHILLYQSPAFLINNFFLLLLIVLAPAWSFFSWWWFLFVCLLATTVSHSQGRNAVLTDAT